MTDTAAGRPALPVRHRTALTALARIMITVFADPRWFRREPRGGQEERSGGRAACRS
ncbi:hypothetical protein [Streptomyces sp. NPDC006463]|uniref:hypothetical protein n=1 Tax=Streptomyces sp. NPDC006463 TaxID=3364746 RepID=UPI00369DC3DB